MHQMIHYLESTALGHVRKHACTIDGDADVRKFDHPSRQVKSHMRVDQLQCDRQLLAPDVRRMLVLIVLELLKLRLEL